MHKLPLTALALTLAASTAAANDLLVQRGSTWKYRDLGTDEGTAWQAVGFDDSLWSSGAAQLGYGDGDETTVVSFGGDPDNKFTTTYFRHEFNVADPSIYNFVVLKVAVDDGAVVYLNGAELQRINMPAGTILFDTFAASTHASAEEHTFQPYAFSPTLLATGANTFAVEVHQRSLTSSDISFDLELVASADPIVTRGPYLQLGTPTSIEVRWRTATATTGRVAYGLAPGTLDQMVDFAFPLTDHSISLTGLLPDTTYYYSIGTTTTALAGADADHFFVTPPTAGTKKKFRIWALGDSGTASIDAQGVRDAYYAFTGATHTDMWLMLGDNAYEEGTDMQYQGGVFDTFADMLRKSVLWPTRGNHEDSLSTYWNLFTLPTQAQAGGVASGTESYYSFDYANVHFICLDSEGSSKAVGGPMYNWLQSDLLATEQDWIIAFWHHPPYSKGSHDSDAESDLIQMRTNFLPLLESHGVDLVLCGHSHAYERSFLLDGHYGSSGTFVDAMKIDDGDGDPAGDGAYIKVMAPNQGAVYVVSGSGSKLSGGTMDHPAMHTNLVVRGSLVIDVDDDVLDVQFLTDSFGATDPFRIIVFPTLAADVSSLQAAVGGVQNFDLKAGVPHALDFYWMFGSLSGTAGVPIGAVTVPLTFDAYFNLTLVNPTASPFTAFLSTLAGDGTASAALTLPPVPTLAGLTANHAYAVFKPTGLASLASNAVELNFQ